jgi:hypothetical protein
MPDDEKPWSLDDVPDDVLLGRLKKIMPDLFADPVAAPLAAKQEHYAPPKDDSVSDKIVAAIEKLGTRGAEQPKLTSAEPVREVIQVVKSWFLDE